VDGADAGFVGGHCCCRQSDLDGAAPAAEKLANVSADDGAVREEPVGEHSFVDAANGDAVIGDMTNVLRMLGAVK